MNIFIKIVATFDGKYFVLISLYKKIINIYIYNIRIIHSIYKFINILINISFVGLLSNISVA